MKLLKRLFSVSITSALTLAMLIAPLFAGTVQAASAPELLRDINDRTTSSDAWLPIMFDDLMWGAACTDDYGSCGLYYSDGTANGTAELPLKIEGEVQKDPSPSNFTVYNGELYFTAETEEYGRELWKTDGTEGGTEMVIDLNPEDGDVKIGQIVEFEGLLYFFANSGESELDLWKTDGTSIGTEMVVAAALDVDAGSSFSVVGDFLFMSYEVEDESLYPLHEDYRGSQFAVLNDTGDTLVTLENFDYAEEALMYFYDYTTLGDSIYITTYEDEGPGAAGAGFYLYRVGDMDPFSVELVKKISSLECEINDDGDDYDFQCDGSGDSDSEPIFMVINDTLVFLAYDGGTYTPWTTDGTELGTVELGSVTIDAEDAYWIGIDERGVDPDLVYFYMEEEDEDDDGDGETQIWMTDGAPENTTSFTISPVGYVNDDGRMFEGNLYFSFCDESEEDQQDCELYRVNGGKTDIELVKDINAGEDSSWVYPFALYDDKLYLVADDGQHGTELWVTDGTALGTELVKDIDTFPKDSIYEQENEPAFTDADETAFFFAYIEDETELWKSDGTEDGTVFVARTGDEWSSPGKLYPFGDKVYFFAEGEDGNRLFYSDGTDVDLVDPDLEVDSSTFKPVVFDDKMYFSAKTDASGYEPHVINETGTVSLLKELVDDADGSNPFGFTTVGSTLYFFTDYDNGDGEIYLHKTDGTSEGTTTYGDGSFDLEAVYQDTKNQIAEFNDSLYFWALSGDGTYLFKTDGEGVIKIESTDDGRFTGPGSLVPVGDKLFFPASGDDFGNELWVTDGTNAGTKLVEDVNVGNGNIYPSFLTKFDNQIWFTDDEDGINLWYSDGETVTMSDNSPYGVFNLVSTAEALYFTGYETSDDYDNEENKKMWKVAQGATEAEEVTGAFSEPSYLSIVGAPGSTEGRLHFFASDSEAGIEPWVITDIEIAGEEENVDEEEEEPEEQEEPVRRRGGGSSINRRVAQSGVTTGTVAGGTPSAVAPGTFTRSLDAGSTGQDVRSLQKFLNGQGFTVAAVGAGSAGNETDFFGPATQSALARFQAANGITPAVGFFGPVTQAFIAAMGAAAPVASETPVVPEGVRDLDMEMTGEDVRALQALLIKQGYPIPAGATAYFSVQTRDALAAYQAKNGITPSVGYFGVKTRTQMTSAGLSGLWW